MRWSYAGFQTRANVFAACTHSPEPGARNSGQRIRLVRPLIDERVIGTTGLTALQGIDDALHLKSGQTILIHGASGGVGGLAIEFARMRGARVLATASGEDGATFVKRLGANAVVDSRTGDITAARAFSPGGIDAVLAQTYLQVPIAAEYALADAVQAQDRMEAGHILGKIVLRIR